MLTLDKIIQMKIVAAAFAIMAALSSCFFNKGIHINKLRDNQVKKMDSVIFVLPFYDYVRSGNPYFTVHLGTEPSAFQKAFSDSWDSVQLKVLENCFKVNLFMYSKRWENYAERSFGVKWGVTSYVFSDTSSFIMALFTSRLRKGKIEEAFSYLPDTLLALSSQNPVVIITNGFFLYNISFAVGLGEDNTGVNFVPTIDAVILKNRKVVYFKRLKKRFMFGKIKDNPQKMLEINQELFDKLKIN